MTAIRNLSKPIVVFQSTALRGDRGAMQMRGMAELRLQATPSPMRALTRMGSQHPKQWQRQFAPFGSLLSKIEQLLSSRLDTIFKHTMNGGDGDARVQPSFS
jgi:hypothetical protein